jgi:hypothetical protein
MPTLNNKTLLSPFETSSGTILELPKHLLYAPSLMTTKYPESSTAFLANNASSNDSKLIKGLNLHPNVNIDASHRIRCAGHIINLVVKATIYGDGVSKWEEELAAAAPKEQFRLFRQLGVVGRLHNFVNAVCVSHKRRELFNEVQEEVNNELLQSFATLELR